MRVTIRKGCASGTAAAPPSKSMAHRMLICAGLSEGESVVDGIAPSQDVLATLDCLKALGAEYQYENAQVRIRGIRPEASGTPVLPCRECGSTLRFLIPVALLQNAPVRFTGSETLMNRPLSVYEEICAQRGLSFEREQNGISVCGRLPAGVYTVPGNISSQFISGLLFALPLLEKDSEIRILPPVESRSYIDLTIQALTAFGIRAAWSDARTLVVPGGQKYRARQICVEGDYSNAAFLEALNLTGGQVNVTGLLPDSLQGDRKYREFFAQLREGTPVIDLADCPDLGPVLMAAAAMLHGAEFTGTARLAMKESDRGAAMAMELAKCGISAERSENRIRIMAQRIKPPKEMLDGHNDHRIVMALSVLLTSVGGTIDGAQAVRKSFPDFFETLQKLNIEVEINGMDQ